MRPFEFADSLAVQSVYAVALESVRLVKFHHAVRKIDGTDIVHDFLGFVDRSAALVRHRVAVLVNGLDRHLVGQCPDLALVVSLVIVEIRKGFPGGSSDHLAVHTEVE